MGLLKNMVRAMKGRTGKVLGGVAAVLFLIPVPALGITFLAPWSFSGVQVNAPAPPAPVVLDSPDGQSTLFTVDLGKAGQVNAGTPTTPTSPGNPGAISFFTAQRPINVAGAQSVRVFQGYQTLLQGGTVQSFVYFWQPQGANTASQFVNVLPNFSFAQGIRYGNVYTQNATQDVNLAAGNYTIVVRLKYKVDRFGIWDNSKPAPGSPYVFSFVTL